MNPYRILYRLGITPWERNTVPTALVELGAQYRSPGRALDIGCGTGRDAVYLAGRGWTVTGVDSVPRALDAAKQRAHASGVAQTKSGRSSGKFGFAPYFRKISLEAG